MPSIDFAALSFLPFGWRREVADALRAGMHARDVVAHLVDIQPHSSDLTIESLERQAVDALDRTRQAGLELIDWADERYPPAVAAIADPPPVLWVRGQIAAFEPPAVAIVGSRAGSAYALAVAERLAGDIASRGIAIVSGLARGVDSAAHRGALAAGGTTIAVLGTGADIVYPSEHKALAREIAATGALVSELPPGTGPLPMFFPMRNRIISGLSRAIVVVEASEKSGSLITARWALEQGRNVLAVPGNVLNGRNRGGHALLKDGAKIVETADDILEELGFAPASGATVRAGSTTAPPGKTAAPDPILACLPPGEASDLDAIAERSGLTVSRLLPRLLELELRGQVRRAGGGRFVRS